MNKDSNFQETTNYKLWTIAIILNSHEEKLNSKTESILRGLIHIALSGLPVAISKPKIDMYVNGFHLTAYMLYKNPYLYSEILVSNINKMYLVSVDKMGIKTTTDNPFSLLTKTPVDLTVLDNLLETIKSKNKVYFKDLLEITGMEKSNLTSHLVQLKFMGKIQCSAYEYNFTYLTYFW
jgi:hypothetical protein